VFHDVYAVRAQEGIELAGLPQVSCIAFVSHARSLETGTLGHVHWFTHNEDPAVE
jgi:hypothetical protein